MKTFEDYLGTHGLDYEGGLDDNGNPHPPTWEPVGDMDEFGRLVVQRFRDWRTTLTNNGLLEQWRRNFRHYHNGPATPSSEESGWGWSDSFQVVGDNGEVLNLRLSEPRNLITHMVNLACAKPAALRAVATRSTPDALEACQVADSVIKEDFDPTSGGQLIRECVELALAVTCGFIDAEWDQFAGEAYMPTEEGDVYYSGKPKYSLRFPDEVCFDVTKRTWRDVEQCIVLQRANRYLLASQFPDLSDKILAVPNISDSEFKPFRYDDEKTDDIVLFRYMHKAGNRRFLPEGRLALVLEDGTVLRDGANPYALVDPQLIGIFPITASSGLGSVYGYAVMNDLSPLSQWLNVMATMAATLIVGYGAPNLAGPNMAGVQVQELVGGGRYFGMPAGMGEIKPLNLLPDLGPLLKMMEFAMSMGEKHSGMNSVVRGQPGEDSSGRFVAMVKSLAVQFMSSLQQSIIATTEQLGNYAIRLRQSFSTAEEIAEISGDSNVQQVVAYKAPDKFKLIAKVRAEAVDPLSQTPEGREQRAQFLMERGAFTSPHQYMMLVKTGRDEPLFKRPMSTLNLINRENQMLLRGEVPTVLEDDLHEQHLADHAQVGDDPDVRADPNVMGALSEHKARHKLAMLGVPFLQGVDPQTGQEYPSAMEQFAEYQATQQGLPPPSDEPQPGEEPPSAPKGGAGGTPVNPADRSPSPAPPPARTAQDAMTDAALMEPPQ